MDDGDPIEKLRNFIYGRWAVVQPTVFPSLPELRVSLDELTRPEAEWFLEAVVPHGREPALFTVEDNNKHLSVRHPPNVGGAPKGNVFFEKSLSGNWCALRLETIIHQGATWRLHDEFRWPLSHLIVESPDVFDAGRDVLRREALDILALEKPCEELPSKMKLAAVRPRVGVEAKATGDQLDHLLQGMQRCHGESGRGHSKSDHSKCLAIEVLQPRFFLGVAAGATWRLLPVVEREGRAVLGDELRLDDLYFDG